LKEWEEFEHDLAAELGLRRVPGSGNQWSHTLDVSGRGTRWSLKYTEKEGYRLSKKDINEAVSATDGIGGTREVPIWAVRLAGADDDFIIMRKGDWISFLLENSFTIPQTKAQERRARGRVPQLMRGTEDE
jgi:hypothetical protein